MSKPEFETVIFQETMTPGGFLDSLRSNKVDQDAFNRLLGAVQQATQETASSSTLNRLLVACLFEVPWEIENTVDHYRARNENLAHTVNQMAEQLREAINDLLWEGLEKYYQGN